jgi:hypothetical protein
MQVGLLGSARYRGSTSALAYYNKAVIYGLLFEVAVEVLRMQHIVKLLRGALPFHSGSAGRARGTGMLR